MSRVSEYLEGKHLSWSAAATRAGLSEDRLREVAAGAEASLSEIRGIAKALRLPVTTLLSDRDSERSDVLFRKMRPKQRDSVAARIISQQVSDLLDIIPAPQRSDLLIELRDASANLDPDGLAALFRQSTGLGELDPAHELANIASEMLHIAVCYGRDPSIEGASVVASGIPFAFLAPRSFKPRMLFTLAHELGHLIAHHVEAEETPILDSEGEIGQIRAPHAASERYADQFASAVLLPHHGVLRTLQIVRQQLGNANGQIGDIEILYLARLYGVSFEVAARRCESLGLTPPGSAIGLYQVICDHHGNPERRADEVGLPKRPELEIPTSRWLVQIAREKVLRGEMSIGRAAEIVNAPKLSILAAGSTPR